LQCLNWEDKPEVKVRGRAPGINLNELFHKITILGPASQERVGFRSGKI
jgi:hypothetical protein